MVMEELWKKLDRVRAAVEVSVWQEEDLKASWVKMEEGSNFWQKLGEI